MTPREILFVDDEPLVLNALRNGLRRQRQRWTMTFAEGGVAALDDLAHATYDVVVSDMRMPGIDGAALLDQLRTQSSHTMRLVLTGYAERSAMARARSVAHHILDKPCDLADLIATIDLACEVRDALAADAVCGIIAAAGKLPPRLAGYPWLAPNTSDHAGLALMLGQLERSGMGPSIVELARSPRLRSPYAIASLSDVASAWTAEGLSAIALLAHGLAQLEVGADDVRDRALHVARRAFDAAPDPLATVAFAAGLLHDIGTRLVAARVPGGVDAATAPAVAAYVLEQWGVALPILHAVIFRGDGTLLHSASA